VSVSEFPLGWHPHSANKYATVNQKHCSSRLSFASSCYSVLSDASESLSIATSIIVINNILQ
jgi:hypothetical protein